MSSLALPYEATDKLKLADWLEICAHIAADGNSSSGDLESALKTASVFESKSEIEQICLGVFSELEQRALAAGNSYPFEIDGSVLSLKSNPDEFLAYNFCLFLSYFRWSTKRNSEISINPWLLFEELAHIAAMQYINGEGIRFGTSRGVGKAEKAAFEQAITDLSQKMGEGKGFKKQKILARKDDKVDLIVWKNFEDKKTSKIVMFGQCAAGDDWTGKVSELQPSAFWRQWMLESRVSPHLRSFYIPHRIEPDEWDFYARKADILFDRCRVAYWAFRDNSAILANANYRKWYLYSLKTDALSSSASVPKAKKKSKAKP